MATLTEASVVARKVIKYGAFGMVGITVLWYLGTAFVKYYQALNPPKLPDPVAGFGKLPKIDFPKEDNRPKLELELPTGEIPNFGDRMVVYSQPIKKSSFKDAESAVEKATSLGFLFKMEQLSESNYVWSNQDQLNSKLDMNIISGHFVLSRQWMNNPALAALGGFSSEKGVITEAENYLSKVGLLETDVVGFEKVTFLKDEGGKLGKALSLSDADFVQLDLFRKNIDEIDPESKTKEVLASYPFYRPDPRMGLIRIIVSGSKNLSEKIIFLDYRYNQIDYKVFSDYPIKTATEAWAELQNGGGYAYKGEVSSPGVKIRRVFLGYYDSQNSTGYAMPVYIFLGDQGFTAYVSAVRDDFIL